MNRVQSYISNISFPTSLVELDEFSSVFNVEMILGVGHDEDEEVKWRSVEWTAPKWCKKGDIVFFMHAKTADAKISALKTELLSRKNEYSNDSFWIMLNALIRAKSLHKEYGGKIFAVGKISGKTDIELEESREELHWKSNIYAPIDGIFLLEKPIDISEINSVIDISKQSSITPVFGSEFDFLKKLIIKKNRYIEDYFRDSVAEPVPLSKVTDDNWLEVLNSFRRSFFLEKQFRVFYVDRLLSIISDIKTIYKECRCIKANQPDTFVDNMIKINGKYLPVEVKLSVGCERDICAQLL